VVVRRGDTLWDLCARHLGDPYAWPRIHALNRDRVANPDLIFPGQEIRIPGT
jgi:nucleoid-associated protein YgaU